MFLLEYLNKIQSGRFDQNSVHMAHSIEQTFFEFHASNRSTFMEMRLKISSFNAYLFVPNYPVASLLQFEFGSNLILKIFFPVIFDTGCRKFPYYFILSHFFFMFHAKCVVYTTTYGQFIRVVPKMCAEAH